MRYLAITNLIENRLIEVSDKIELRYGKAIKDMSLKVLISLRARFSTSSPKYYKRLLLISGYCDHLFTSASRHNRAYNHVYRSGFLTSFSQRVQEKARKKNSLYTYEKTPSINRLINIVFSGNPNFNRDQYEYNRSREFTEVSGDSGNITSKINLKFPYEMSIRWIPKHKDTAIEILNKNTLNKNMLNMHPLFVSDELIMHTCADNIARMSDKDLDIDELKNFEELKDQSRVTLEGRIPVEKKLDSKDPFGSLISSI